uniref:E3 ubiquitin-protein ligase listerin n=1 Tax=Strigamia maritima TaxID=126957 RepID=T1IH75_STRMM
MGGKRNQANRTKGNARPSSSGRTADKLATNGNILPNFVGFSGFVVDPVQGNDEHVNLNINADLRLAMKKMTKKDVTTKLKAIQEFTDSCQKLSSEEIKAMLSAWPRLFNKLSMDHDRRVREALFQAHEQVVIQTHKNLAPYLRNIMGSWIIAQCDTCAPAASAAQNSFKAAFPPAKQAEAVAFCKLEIIGLIEDNLFQQTARTLSDPDTTPVEEMEAKYIRIITSSFLAWKHILTVMPKTEHESLMENYSKMFSELKFWKFAKHESPLIRNAWFSLISTTSQLLPAALNEKKLCPLVLGSLDDSDASVSPVVWEAAMYTLVTFNNCWNHVNARKAVLPKLWTVLQEGGNGNASVIYPNLLPFLNKIPAQVMGDPMQFYSEFFARMRKGLSAPRIQSSPSEIASIIKAYMECLKFIATKHNDNDNIKIEYLIADQLLPVLQSSLQEKSSKINTTNFYELFMELLQHWDNNAKKIHVFVLKQFELTCKEVLELQDETDSLSRLGEMFERLLGKTKKKKTLHVQFVDAVEEIEDVQMTLPLYLSDQEHLFYRVLCKVCSFALQVARKTNSMPHFKFLALITSCYSNSYFLLNMTEKEASADELVQAGKLFFQEIVLPWLSFDLIKNHKDFPENFINLAFAAYSCADNKSKFEILDILCKTQNPAIIEQLLYKADYYRADKTFMKWLKSEAFESTLQELTQQLRSVSASQSPNVDVIWRILSFSFSTGVNLEPLVSSACLGQILNIFQQALSRESLHLEPSLQFLCNLASKLFVNFKECWSITSTTELLVTMFATTCQPPRSLSGIIKSILCQVESTWLLGIDSFVSLNDGLKPGGFFHQAAKVIQNAIFHENSE